MRTSAQIRQQFIDFFAKKHGHEAVPSSPVVPHNDPTLLFTNAGMNQFKDVFLGQGDRPYTRAVDTQKCIRAGGKHNDLDDVGKDTYHHTFFEMLGNWSFGDYFKKEAIDWAWELLTKQWGLDAKRLHATYFGGDPEEGLEADREAQQLWRQYLPDEQIHPGSKKDNFWEMGDTGPCGPCSEIHYDRTPDFSGAKLVNADSPLVIEIWNLVFIQFNRTTAGLLQQLPAKHVDTGMGFERICAVLQGKTSNYDTDVFTPLFAEIQRITDAPDYTGDLKKPVDIAYRVIADHIRCLTFALTDGAHCGADGRDYVLRSILRRAVRYGRQTLGKNEPFLHKLVPAVVDLYKDAFPELASKPEQVAAEIREEEEAFGKTLDRGIALFEEAAERGGKQISGEDAFRLHDTYGFPFTLTRLMAEERGLSVDEAAFKQEMEAARQRSRAQGEGFDEKAALADLVQQMKFEPTEFVGYEATEIPAEAMRLRVFKHGPQGFAEVNEAMQGDRVAVVTGRTPFYAEAGGQVGDVGVIQVQCGGRVKVTDTQKLGDAYFHLGEVVSGPFAAAEHAPVAMAVQKDRRHRIMCNHTVTHVMNRALRDHVNREADQKGSLVDEQRLRFDFSHGKALTPEQISAVEQQVNADIASDLPVHYDYAPQEEALGIKGLRAVFGEKYPPRVRVVSIGQPVSALLAEPESDQWAGRSIEFCGGTHLKRTGEAESFAIVSEEAVGKGVRRITALTGAAARQASSDGDRLLNHVQTLLDGPSVEERRDEIEALQTEMAQKTLPLSKKQQIQQGLQELMRRVKEHDKQRGRQDAAVAVDRAREIADAADAHLVIAKIDGADANALRSAMDVVRKKQPDAALLLIGDNDGKVSVVAAVPDAKIKQGLKAGDWVREVAKVVGGGGGGRPDMAQAGGKDPTKINDALETARTFAEAKL